MDQFVSFLLPFMVLLKVLLAWENTRYSRAGHEVWASQLELVLSLVEFLSAVIGYLGTQHQSQPLMTTCV